jgi:glutathione peroxidase-family protein
MLLKGTPGAGALAAPTSLYEFSALQYGEPVPFKRFADCVTVVVNVASE